MIPHILSFLNQWGLTLFFGFALLLVICMVIRILRSSPDSPPYWVGAVLGIPYPADAPPLTVRELLWIRSQDRSEIKLCPDEEATQPFALRIIKPTVRISVPDRQTLVRAVRTIFIADSLICFALSIPAFRDFGWRWGVSAFLLGCLFSLPVWIRPYLVMFGFKHGGHLRGIAWLHFITALITGIVLCVVAEERRAVLLATVNADWTIPSDERIMLGAFCITFLTGLYLYVRTEIGDYW